MASRAGQSLEFTHAGDAITWAKAAFGSTSLQQQIEIAIQMERAGGFTPQGAQELRMHINQMQQDLFHHGNGGAS